MNTKHLPHILSESKALDKVNLKLEIPRDLVQFDGHFPGFAILPGIVQIDWVAQLARRYFQWEGQFSSLQNIKFHDLVLPGAQLDLEILFEPAKNGLFFSYFSGSNKYSSGTILFKRHNV